MPGYSRCWELGGKSLSFRILLLSHTHQKLISSTTVERTAHGGIGGHAAHCSCITTGARSWNLAELPRPVNAYAPNQRPNEAERVGRVRGREAGFEWELPFGDPGPEDFALDTIAIFEYSIAFDAGKGTCRPRRVRCLQVLPVTRNVLNEGMVAGATQVSPTYQSRPLNTAPQTIPKTTRFLLPCGPFTLSPPGGSSERDLPQPSTSIIFAHCTINSVHFAN